MNLKRILAAALSVATLLSLTACSGGAASSNTPSKTDPASAPSTASQAEAGKVVYPIPGSKKLSIYGGFNYCTNAYSSRKESPVHKWLAEATGVELEWIEVPNGADASTYYNAMLADPSSLPDIICSWGVRGNSEQYVRDGIQVDITDELKTNAPDYLAYLDANPNVKKGLTLDSGKMPFVAGMLRETNWLRTYQGLACRGDLLQKCGLEVPTTVDEFENLIKTFKEKYNSTLKVENGMVGGSGAISGAFGVVSGFYVDSDGDKKIHFGGVEDGYREFLKRMNKWYKEGWLDPEFTSYDTNLVKASFIDGSTATISTTGGRISSIVQEAEKTGKTEVKIQAIPNLTLEKGGKNYFGQAETATREDGCWVTTNCKDVATAVQFLNYGFTKEGELLYNFGKEGVSFEMKDGTPTFTDAVRNDELGIDTAVTKYSMTRADSVPTVQLEAFYRGYNRPEAIAAIDVWEKSKTDDGAWVVPEITPTSEEADQTSTIETAITTYLNENTVKFETGELDINDDAAWNKFKSDLNNYGLETVLKVKNDQLDRYNKRGN